MQAMKRRIAILTILTLIMSILVPFSALASDGTSLYKAVDKALNGGQTQGISGITTKPTDPSDPRTKNLNYFIAHRQDMEDCDENGNTVYDVFEAGTRHEYQKPRMILGVDRLEATEKSTFADS